MVDSYTEVWRKIRSISGKSKKLISRIYYDQIISNIADISEVFADHFEAVSSSTNYTPEFQVLLFQEKYIFYSILDTKTAFSVRNSKYYIDKIKEKIKIIGDVMVQHEQQLVEYHRNNLEKIVEEIIQLKLSKQLVWENYMVHFRNFEKVLIERIRDNESEVEEIEKEMLELNEKKSILVKKKREYDRSLREYRENIVKTEIATERINNLEAFARESYEYVTYFSKLINK